jgi:hypothetical protein
MLTKGEIANAMNRTQKKIVHTLTKRVKQIICHMLTKGEIANAMNRTQKKKGHTLTKRVEQNMSHVDKRGKLNARYKSNKLQTR